MHRIPGCAISCSALAALAGACITVDPNPDYDRAAQHIREATGRGQVYRPQNHDVALRVQALLRDGISIDDAVDICLLNHPRIQAGFLEVGMARADLVQAGLLSNPSVEIAFRFPSGGGLANLEAGVAQNIADLWRIPARRRAAARHLERTILALAADAAELAADTKKAYYTAVGRAEAEAVARDGVATAKALLASTMQEHENGHADGLHVNLARSLVLSAELDAETAHLEAADARRRLAERIGITTDADRLVLTDPLPALPTVVLDPDRLIEFARGHRLDLRAAGQAVAQAAARLEHERRSILDDVDVGLELERESRQRQGGRDVLADIARASIGSGSLTAPSIQPRSDRRRHAEFSIGPSLDIELPIFDQNQARIAEARLAYRRAIKMYEALDRPIAHAVREAVDHATSNIRLVALYRDRAVPLARDNLDLSVAAHRAGEDALSTLSTLFHAHRTLLTVRLKYVDMWEAAATTIPELERVAGAPFPDLVAAPQTEPAATPGPDPKQRGRTP